MPATTSSGIPDPTIPHPEAKDLPAGWALLKILPGVLLLLGPVLLYAVACVMFLPTKTGDGNYHPDFYFRLLATFVPPMAYLLWTGWRMDRAGYPKGRDLFRKRLFGKAIPHLVKAQRNGHPDAGRMLGDILLLGLDGAPHPVWAALYYRRAAADLDAKMKILGILDAVGNGSALIAETRKEIPTDIPAWHRGMIEGLETRFSGIPEICSVLSLLHCRLGDIDAALSYARKVPDRKESPNQRESLLELLPAPSDLLDDEEAEADSDETPRPEPGVPVGRTVVDGTTVEQVVVCIVLAGLTLWGADRLIEPGFGRLAAMAVAGAIGWRLVKRIGRRDRFLVGERHFRAGRHRAAATIFSRLSHELDPRADKRLGDMHHAGLGVDENPLKAVIAYTNAFAKMKVLEIMADPESPTRIDRIVAAIDAGGGGDALAASMKRPLAALADKGHVLAHSLLADIGKRLKDKDGEIEHARAACRASPDSDNEVRLAYALVDDGNGSGRIGEGLDILERRRRDGTPSAISALVSYHCGKLVAAHKDAGQALECYRELRQAVMDAGKEKKRAREPLVIDSILLLESFGPGILTDDDIRMGAALGKQRGR